MSYLRNEIYTGWFQYGSSIIYTDGNVGIGTNNPLSTLDVRGNINVSGVSNLATLNVTTANLSSLSVTGLSNLTTLNVSSLANVASMNVNTANASTLIVTSNVGVRVATPQTPLDVATAGTFLGAGGAATSFTYGDVRIISGNMGNGFTIPYFQVYQNGNSTSVGVPGYSMAIQPFNFATAVTIGYWANRGAAGGLDTPQQMWFPNSQAGIIAKATWLNHRPTNAVTGSQAPVVAGGTDYLNYSNPVNSSYSASSIYSNFGSLALTPATSGITIIARVLFGAASSGQNSYERICDFGNGAAVDNICLGRSSTTNQLFTSIFKGGASAGNLVGGTIVQNAVTNVAMKYSPTAGFLYLYQNGALVGSLASAAATYAIDNTRTNCYLGRSNFGDTMFTGYIYQFQCHNSTLTDQEIFTIMNSWGSVPAMTVTTEGRVGIGTTTPASALQVVGSVTNTNPAFSVYRSTALGTPGTIIFNIASINRGSAYNTSTGIFTAPVAGIYYFSFFCMANSAASLWVQFFKNGALVNVGGNPYNGYPSNAPTGTFGPLSGSILMSLNVGDTANLNLTTGTMYSGGNMHNGFVGYLVG
jgi:hypothetical protein